MLLTLEGKQHKLIEKEARKEKNNLMKMMIV